MREKIHTPGRAILSPKVGVIFSKCEGLHGSLTVQFIFDAVAIDIAPDDTDSQSC